MNIVKWDHRRFGTLEDPIHKSDLNNIAGPYGCLRAFEYGKRSARDDESAEFASGKACAGNAVHETIARALTNPRVFPDRCPIPIALSADSVAKVYDQEFAKAVDGREVAWGRKDNPAKVREERIAMVVGLLSDLHNHVAEIVAVESAYIAQLGDYWLSGHIDLVYRPKSNPSALAMCDWKTGAQLPDQILLDHGFESGLYSQACATGLHVDRDDLRWYWDDRTRMWTATHDATGTVVTARTRFAAERDCLEQSMIELARGVIDAEGSLEGVATFGEFPEVLRYVHLGDYVPYTRAGAKAPNRPEQLAWYGCEAGDKVKYKAGDLRGPGWYEMRRSEHDVPRLETLVRKLVGVVRLGRFFESLGEKCRRCNWRDDCLTSGYELRGDDAAEAKRILDMLPSDAA